MNVKLKSSIRLSNIRCRPLKDKNHKFHDNLMMTYSQYFRTQFSRVISIIRALEAKFGSDEVRDVLIDWAERFACDSVRSTFDDFSSFKQYWKSTLESENWEKILTCSFPEESDARLECNYSECLWAETMKDMNSEDIGYILFCHGDFAMTKAMSPNLRLERTKTLMQGDNFCDHIYYWDE